MTNIDNKDINEKIRRSMRDTANDHIEHGFNICLDGNNVTTTDIEKGKRYGLNVRNSCAGQTVGNFHTHTDMSVTRDDAIPSPKDIMKSVSDNIPFFCIGGLKKGNNSEGIIRCFDKKDMEAQVIDAVRHAHNRNVGKSLNDDELEKGSKLLVKRMIKDKDFLNQHSLERKINI